ncbi:hypothetical protein DBR42_02710, partial [Pelomonas sp. HMWF004]
DGEARIFVRLVNTPSLHARELQQGLLFHRIGAAFTDLQSCLATAALPLRQLVSTAQRQQPCRNNLFAAVTYDRRAWELVVDAVDCWQRRPHAGARCISTMPQVLRKPQRQLSMLARRPTLLQAALAAKHGIGREA